MRTPSRMTTAAIAIVATGTRDLPDTRSQTLNGASAMSVACEPNQRAIVHPAVVNGASMSQVECVSSGAPAVAYQPSAMPVAYTQPAYGYSPLDNTRVVPVSNPAARTVAPRRYASTPVRYERTTRSVKKSALIIGGSAGAGAGIGAAIGGKKGALIGALLGGGGATVWDQLTRHGG